MRGGLAVLLLMTSCLSVKIVCASEPPAKEPILAYRDWSVRAAPNLLRDPPLDKEVQAFVSAIEVSLGIIDSVDKSGRYVCSYAFYDLRHDGFLSLVGSTCPFDRPSDTYLSVIDKTPSGFVFYWSAAALGPGQSLSSSIRDLQGDGKIEFVLDKPLGSIASECLANWTAIYAWTGSNYTNVSDKFKGIYKERLVVIEKTLPAIRSGNVANGYMPQDTVCLEAEAGAIQSFLGISSRPAEDQAVRLATSGNVAEREFGTQRLIQIGISQNRKYLEKLVGDPDYGVSMAAKQALEYRGTHQFPPESFQRVGVVGF